MKGEKYHILQCCMEAYICEKSYDLVGDGDGDGDGQ